MPRLSATTDLDEAQRSVEGPVVLLVEDDRNLQRVLGTSLRANGYRTTLAASGEAALIHARSRNPDIVVLDLGLPDMDGREFMTRAREWTKAPVLVISARGTEQDKVLTLDHGADDYLTKPFGMDEFLARLRLSLRRVTSRPGVDPKEPFCLGDLVVDLHARRVVMQGRQVRLTPTEYKILAVLVQRAGTVVPGRELLTEVWGAQYAQQDRYLRVYMVHLRKKIEPTPHAPRYVVTEPGVGYRLGFG